MLGVALRLCCRRAIFEQRARVIGPSFRLKRKLGDLSTAKSRQFDAGGMVSGAGRRRIEARPAVQRKPRR